MEAAQAQKVRSIRATDEVYDKFKALAAGFDNQGEALSSLIAAWEMQQAKAVITNRATEISDYDSHLQALQTTFLRALELNENTENRVRQEFRTQLDSKDQTIADLQGQLAQAKAAVKEAEDRAAALQEAATELKDKLKEAELARETAEESAADRRAIITSLQRELDAAKADETMKQEAQAQVKAAEEAAQKAIERARKLELELANTKAQAELEVERKALESARAVLEARQEKQDVVDSLLTEKHALLQQIEKLQASSKGPASDSDVERDGH